MDDIAILAVILASVSVVRVQISRLPITGPLLFVLIGMALSPDALDILDIGIEDEGILLTAELTLGLLLFSDAARINASTLRKSLSLPTRLLAIGLPLSIGLGTVIAMVTLTDVNWAAAALLGAVLAPTDAALGQAVVSNEKVPVRVRQTLNVESGLNDGLVVPIVAVFGALVTGDVLESRSSIVGEAVGEILIGAAVGLALGQLIGRVNPWVHKKKWTDLGGAQLVAFSVAVTAFTAATTFGGNGFIAAFVCGLTVRALIGEKTEDHVELAENVGQIGAEVTFVVFGATMVVPALQGLSFEIVLFSLAILTLGRILPVRLAMIGTELKPWTVLFIGWFGPRGLASLLFGLIILEKETETGDGLFTIIAVTIFFSVVLHGITAAPLSNIYSKWFTRQGHPEMAEAGHMPESPIRWRLNKWHR